MILSKEPLTQLGLLESLCRCTYSIPAAFCGSSWGRWHVSHRKGIAGALVEIFSV